MGVWGFKIFQNDTALDVKDQYIILLKDGKTTEEANRLIVENNQDVIELGDYDELEFWMALAMLQWSYGRLDQEVKVKALKCLEGDWHQTQWKEESPKLLNKRIAEINTFITIINTPQPPEKIVKPYKIFACPWAIGDIYAYRLESEESHKRGCYGHYIAFQKVGNAEGSPRNIIPRIRVACKIFPEIPTIEQYVNEKKLPQFCHPVNYLDPSLQTGMLKYQLKDVNYDKIMDASSIRSYPKNIVFIGNSLPIREEYKEHSQSFQTGLWKDFEKFFYFPYDSWKDADIRRIV